MSKIKDVVIKLDKITINKYQYATKLYNKKEESSKSKIKKTICFLKCYRKGKIVKHDSYDKMFYNLVNKVSIKIEKNDTFFYFIDKYLYFETINTLYGNCSPDYSIFLDNSLKDLIIKCDNDSIKINVLNSIIKYIQKVIKIIKKSNVLSKARIINALNNFIEKPCVDMFEALQRILLINQLLWQTGHKLIGLGRLDFVLNKYIDEKLDDKNLESLLCDFIKTLHKYYPLKSNMMLGDTGQIIILGGLRKDRSYFCNKITYLCLKALAKADLPDPKILLRISKNTPNDLLELSLKIISTGLGSPLLSNDEVTIQSLLKFGYDEDDAYNYTTSACWELIANNSFEQNNLRSVNFIAPFSMISKKKKIVFSNFKNFLNTYIENLKLHTNNVVSYLENLKWEYDPLLSLCLRYCYITKKDISQNGAKYNNYGLLSVGLSNAVNSIINIEEIVFNKKIFSYEQLNKIISSNFSNNANVSKYLKGVKLPRFGEDDDRVICLSKLLINTVSDQLKDKKNNIGGKFKFGLSSPSYLSIGKNCGASFDGRYAKLPLSVHISNDLCTSYTSLINFASSLNYNGNRFNGNVLDLMISPNLILKNFNKIIELLKISIEKGLFEIQFNVVSSSILIKAKNDKNFMPNLIVRVWGFSSYFHDLPLEYKNLLIKRALENEHKSF